MKIMPAPLELTVEDLRIQLVRLTPYFKSFQIDVADGEFVPNKTVQLEEIASVLPLFPDIVVDFHLMVNDWNRELDSIDAMIDTTVRYVLIHSKTDPAPEVFTNVPENYRLGLVINPDEDVETIVQKYDLSQIPAIQIMTVIPGKQGQPFIESSLNKIEQLRRAGYKLDIIIDGAVNTKTLPLILSRTFVPDYAGIGSFLTKSKNLAKTISELDATEGVTRA